MEFLSAWGLFLLDTITIVIAIIIVLLAITAIAGKNKIKHKGKLSIKKINEGFDKVVNMINEETLPKHHIKMLRKSEKKADKQASKKSKKDKSETKSRLFVVDFNGDIKASEVSAFRECITAILLTATDKDSVLVRLESPGGMVNAYGLAASQLQRLRNANIPLTIAVDKVAASGGYMMACIANKIICAPFAVIGSIGVVFQLPNFHRLLEKKDIDFEQLTAGEYKRTITMFGENTDKGREKTQEDINEIHELFKAHIKTHREQVDIDQVATGEHWFGSKALELKLVDNLQTSDDFILDAKDHFDIYQLEYRFKQPLGKKLAENMSQLSSKLLQWNLSQSP